MGAVAGLVCTIGVIAILIGKVRESFGLGLASASFVPALLIYAAALAACSTLLRDRPATSTPHRPSSTANHRVSPGW